MGRIGINNPTISLIYFINTPPNPPSNNMLSITESGAKIHLVKQSTTTMAPVILSDKTIA